jgi:1-acyl-sn-glycerol-3-phosphate acyltransferase
LSGGATWLLERFIGRLEVTGQHHVPRSGPALVLANHPGLSDSLALFASIPRADLRVLAADRPFLRALPCTSEWLVYLAERPERRLRALRGVAAHLRAGGTMLTFPAGTIEPDPLLRPGGAQCLGGWDERLNVLTRIARDVPIIPTVVRGVLSPAAQRSVLTRLRRQQRDREWLGSVLQTFWRGYQQVTVHVDFGAPIVWDDCACDSFTRQIITAERKLMSSVSKNGLHP